MNRSTTGKNIILSKTVNSYFLNCYLTKTFYIVRIKMNYPAAELRGITKCHQTLLTDLGELDCIGFPAL